MADYRSILIGLTERLSAALWAVRQPECSCRSRTIFQRYFHEIPSRCQPLKIQIKLDSIF
ncbi:MAG: hypothetical protein HHJ12_00315 [Glaciimonas sp.]|nr:hypothetical protein [Glaciimonas sp.]